MRSLLFVPGDSPKKIDKALSSGADILLLDLEDSVAPSAKGDARQIVADLLKTTVRDTSTPKLYVRINALDTGFADADLDQVVTNGLSGILLPKCTGGMDVQHLSAKLAVREAEEQRRFFQICDETPRAVADAVGTASHHPNGIEPGGRRRPLSVEAEHRRHHFLGR